jgi:tetratricopeptide (TPR) repeat protein
MAHRTAGTGTRSLEGALLRSAALLVGVLLPATWACGLRYDAEEEEAALQEAASAGQEEARELPPAAEAWSLLGEPLTPPEPSEEARVLQEGFLTEARAELAADPGDADAAIWVGRRLAYLGRFGEAIAAYTEAMEAHPDDARFYRHRGHRYITVRRLDDAIADFRRAVDLIEGTEDEIEPDGLPNALGIPLGTLHFNIWYHLGLAHYLQGDLEAALEAYRSCMEVSTNPDLRVATGHWLYMTLRELGRDDEAAAVLEPFSADMEIIENDSYHRLILLYRGELSPNDLVDPAAVTDPSTASMVYGVGNWYRYNGQPDRATEIFRTFVEGTDQWAAFGFIAAEAVLAREER